MPGIVEAGLQRKRERLVLLALISCMPVYGWLFRLCQPYKSLLLGTQWHSL
jgi:hypothetical protein